LQKDQGLTDSPVRFSPDGQRLVASSADGSVRLWDAQSGRLLCEPFRAAVSDMGFSPDGQRLLTVSGGVQIWDLRNSPAVSLPLYGETSRELEPETQSADGQR